MIDISFRIEDLTKNKETKDLLVFTLGRFELIRLGQPVSAKEWGRDSTLQLFQYFITHRQRHGVHKEQIVDRLWGHLDPKAGIQNFKIAHHGMNKVLEPNRKSRAESKYIVRQGASYQLDRVNIWIDAEALDEWISIGNSSAHDPGVAKMAYTEAINIYKGMYLPDRLYNDWTTEERERIQLLVLGCYINLSELLVKESPLESIRLAQQALLIDHTWEDAYRIQMEAYMIRGNRPMAIKTYQQCEKILLDEFGISPLPETKRLYLQITGIQ